MLAYIGIAASLLVTGIAAQNSNLPAGFNPALISADEKCL
jgi:hypothetical protein